MKKHHYILGALCLIMFNMKAQTVVETVSSGTSGDATLIIEADTDNNNEEDNPKIMLKQDNSLIIGEIGLNGSGSQYTGAIDNSMFLGSILYSDLQLITNDIARMTINKQGNVGVGTNTPAAKFDVENGDLYVGEESSSNGTRRQIRVYGFDNSNKFYGSLHSNYDDSRRTFDINTNSYVQQIKIDASANSYANIFLNPGVNNGVGIGTSDTKGFKLGVQGKIAAEEVKVATYSNWSDFVFENNYNLPTLKEVEQHIKDKGHLKDIPNAEEVKKNGFFLGEMDSKLLQKIEELTLYTIEQQKEIESLKKENNELKSLSERLAEIEKLLKAIKN